MSQIDKNIYFVMRVNISYKKMVKLTFSDKVKNENNSMTYWS